ncbi:MAG: methyltransferase domain-containing protein [Xanthobacteraceae bacterium]
MLRRLKLVSAARPTKKGLNDYCAEIRATLPNLDAAALLAKHPGSRRLAKYAKQDDWIRYNANICRVLNLIDAPKQRILDVGCGGGLFLRCARHFGHDGFGIDVENPLLAEIAAIYGVDRRVAPVRKFTPLEVDGLFDVITCVATQFDRRKHSEGAEFWDSEGAEFWGCAEWRFFFEDLDTRMPPTGRVYLRINKEGDLPAARDYYNERLRDAMWHANRGLCEFLFDKNALAITIDSLSRHDC